MSEVILVGELVYSEKNISLKPHMIKSDNKKSMLSTLKELNTSKPVEKTEKKTFLMKDIKKNTNENLKEKKKKKKKSNEITDSTEVDLDDIINTTLQEQQPIDVEQIVSDSIDEVYEEVHEFDIGDSIIQKEKRKYNSRKNSDNNYKKEFAEELTLLYNLLDEVTKFGKDAQKIYESTMVGRSRGVSGKTMTDYAQMLLASQNNRLAIIKELSSIKKTIADLGIKDAKSKNESSNGLQDTQLMAASFLRNITNLRTNNNIVDLDINQPQDTIKGLMNNFDEDRYFNSINMDKTNMSATNAQYGIPTSGQTYQSTNTDSIADYLEHRLDSYNPGPKDYSRSEEGNKYIMYENLSPSIVIDKHEDTGEWEFVAIDKFENIIDDYPLPTKSSMRIKFSDDGRYATDQTGKLYPVRLYI